MGLTYIDAEVANFSSQAELIRFLVDSGANYSLLPQEVWQRLGLQPMRRVSAVLADGSVLERDVSECRICLEGIAGTTPVLLGEAGDEALMGVVTLENLGLMLNPYQRTLQPLRVRL